MEVLDWKAASSYSLVRLVGKNLNEIISGTLAFKRAEELGMDLVLVSDKSNPPVVKIQDFKKLQYEQKKARKPQKKISLKEVQLRINISDHDLQTKINAINKFLSNGDNVKVVLKLKGREREYQERIDELFNKIQVNVQYKFQIIMGPIPVMMFEPHPLKTEQSSSALKN